MRPLLRPWALTALIGLVYLLVAPPTTDLAAQFHRTALAERGVWLIDLSWFGGHHLPSYSVLSPLLGRWLGPTGVGVLAAIVGAAAFAQLVRRAWGAGSGTTLAAWWFAGGIGALLFTGRIAFLLGVALALLTLLALLGRRPPAMAIAATAGAVLTALASPVAALFLALVGVAVAAGRVTPTARRLALLTAAVGFAAAVALALAFPGGGSEPFVLSALLPAIVLLALMLLVIPREERGLRVGIALYLAAIVLAGVLATPMGGNATRLAALVGGPLLVAAGTGQRGRTVLLLAVPFLYWQLYPPVRDATQAWGDPSARAAYWAPADRTLQRLLAAEPGRVDVPPTARRGEARWLAPEVPLARGWVRQLDRHRNPLFYDERPHAAAPISGTDYRRWLDANAVRWVALPDATPDYASRRVVALLRGGQVPGLVRVWTSRHWMVWRVEGATPLVAPATGGRPTPRVTRLDAARLRFADAPIGVSLRLALRWSPWLRVVEGDACLREAADGWTTIVVGAPGTVSVGSALAEPGSRTSTAACAP